MLALIEWFRSQKVLPRGPYLLRSGSTILDADKFYMRLRDNIAYGPGSPRGITGSLKTDLEDLKTVIENGQWP